MLNLLVHKNVMQKRYFGLDRNIFFTGLTSFLTDTSTKMVYSIMPLFLLSIGASKTTLSVIEGIAESTASLLKALSGFWSDKTGKKKPFMILGYSLTALITPVYAFVITPFQVLVFRFIERVGKGIRTAPRDSLISGSMNKNEAGKSFGFHKAMDNSGAILGPLFAGLLLYVFPAGYKHIFLFAAIPAVMGVLTLLFYIREIPVKRSEVLQEISVRGLSVRFWYFLLIMFVFSLGNSTDALLLVKTSESGVKSSYVPFLYMLFNSVAVLLAIPVGKLSDKRGRGSLIVLGFLIYALVYFLFGSFNNIKVFAVAFVLYGCYSALADSCQKALVADIVGTKIKGTGFGLYHAVLGISLLPASIIAGLLYDKVSSAAPFYFGAIMALLAALLMALFTGYRKVKDSG